MSSMYPPSAGGGPLRACARCGSPLPPNDVPCATCGYQNAPFQQAQAVYPPSQSFSPHLSADSSWGPPPQQAPITGGPFNGSAWGPPPSQPLNGAFPPPQAPQTPPPPQFPPQPWGNPPTNGSGFPAPGPMNGPGGSGFYPGYGAPPAPPQQAYFAPPSFSAPQPGSMNGYGGYAPNSYNDAPQSGRRTPKWGIIIGSVVLLVILLGGSIFGLLKLLNRHPSSSPTAQQTPIVTPSVTPLFSDTFQSNSAGWDLSSQPPNYQVNIANKSMVLQDNDNKLLWEILPGKTFGDFRIDVDAGLTQGDAGNGYGLYIRGTASQDSNLGLYYRFELYGDSTFAVFKGAQDSAGNTQSTKIKDFTTSSAINKQGQMNHLTIIANGAQMTFQVNGTTLYTYTDASYKSGSVAMFVSNLPGLKAGAQATFQNLAVFPAS